MIIENAVQLRKLYSFPSGRAKDKMFSTLDKHAIHFISKSPFAILSTCNTDKKMDASPRGGNPGFVKVYSNNVLVIPDAKGNNRLDSLVNIINSGTIGILFLIPGIDETLRLNGKAVITTDEEYLNLFSDENIAPKTCILVNVEEVFLHCAKALMRSKLWLEDTKINRNEFPTMGEMLKDQLGGNKIAESQEDMVKRYKKDL